MTDANNDTNNNNNDASSKFINYKYNDTSNLTNSDVIKKSNS